MDPLSISDWTRDPWKGMKGVRFWGVFFSGPPDRDSIRGVDFLVCLLYKSIFAHRKIYYIVPWILLIFDLFSVG